MATTGSRCVSLLALRYPSGRRCVSERPSALVVVAALALLLARPDVAAAAGPDGGVKFPADAGVVDVRRHGAVGDGRTDDSDAFQRAIDALPHGRTMYVPDGTYLLSRPLAFKPTDPKREWLVRFTVRGQSRDGAVLRLADRAAAFQDASKPAALVQTKTGNEAFEIRFADLTIDTGKGNPGANGLLWTSCNGGSLMNLRIRSGDGAGRVGLDSETGGSPGRALVRGLTVEGFDYGLTLDDVVNGFGYEHVTLRGQNKFGAWFKGNNAVVRGLRSENRVPAVRLEKAASVAIVDAELTGGAPDAAAIDSDGILFARHVRAAGYATPVRSGDQRLPAAPVEEFTSEAVASAFPSQARSLNLPVEDAPAVPWDAGDNFARWVNVRTFGAVPGDDRDDADAIQAALDAARRMGGGGGTVYFPTGDYHVGRTLDASGVARLAGMPARLAALLREGKWPHTAKKFADGSDPVLIRFGAGAAVTAVEDLHVRGIVEHAAPTTLAFARGGSLTYRNSTPGGRAFFDDFGANTTYQLKGPQQVWVRFWDGHGVHPAEWWVPTDGERQVLADNDGGTLWLFALHGEGANPMTMARTSNGGRTEVLSINSGAPWGDDDKFPPEHFAEFVVRTGGRLSVAASDVAYRTLVEEQRGEWTRYVRGGRGALAVASPPQGTPGPPPPVAGLRAEPAGQWPFRMTVSWQPAAGEGVAGYELLRDGARVAFVEGTSYTDTLATDDTAVTYAVRTLGPTMARSPDATLAARTATDATPLKLEAVHVRAAVAAWSAMGSGDPSKHAREQLVEVPAAPAAAYAVFSKPVTPDAADVWRYTVRDAPGGSVPVTAAALEPDGRTVALTLGGDVAAGGSYEVVAENITDRATRPTTLPEATATGVATGPGGGLLAAYWPGEAVPPTSADAPWRPMRAINANWEDMPPAPNVPKGPFVGRFAGRVRADRSGPHTFVVVSPDGGRLWVDGKLLLDTWDASKSFGEGGANARLAAPIDLVAGRLYDVRFELCKRGGNARARLEWVRPGGPEQLPVPPANFYPPANAAALPPPIAMAPSPVGLSGRYYDTPWPNDRTPVRHRLDPTLDFDWGRGPAIEGGNDNYFLVVWRGWVVADQTGEHTFAADDPAEWDAIDVDIDGQRVIACNRRWNAKNGRDAGTVWLEAGRAVPIRVQFRDQDWSTDGGAARMRLTWAGPGGGTPRVAPASMFRPLDPPTDAAAAAGGATSSAK